MRVKYVNGALFLRSPIADSEGPEKPPGSANRVSHLPSLPSPVREIAMNAACRGVVFVACLAGAVPTGEAVAADACFDLSQQHSPPGQTFLINKCTGTVWLLSRFLVPGASGPNAQFTYGWSIIKNDSPDPARQ